MAEVRHREPVKKPTSSSSNVGGIDDSKIQPDRVLVFARSPETELDLADSVAKGVALLKKAGFYVSCRKGARGSVLLLVRATPRLLNGSVNRALTVQQALPLKTLRELPAPLSDEFSVAQSLKPLGNVSSFSLSTDTLNKIETIYGGQTAGVFQLANSLTRWLVSIAAIGAFMPLDECSPLFTGLTLVWGALFVTKWSASQPKPIISQLSNNGKNSSTREHRRLLFLPLALLMLVVYTIGLVLVFLMEIACTQLYAGQFASIIKIVPALANVAASIVFSAIYSKVINKYTEWEEYDSEEELAETRAQRSFYLEALLGYVPLVLTAFFYLPFGAVVANRALVQLKRGSASQYLVFTNQFKLNSLRLKSQATFYTAKQQLIALIMNTGIPLSVRFLKRSVLKQANTAGNNRFALLQLQAPFNTHKLASSLVLAFGYVLLLAPVWPLAALFTLLGLWIRTRGSLYMLTSATRPPLYAATRNIGFWNSNLKALVCFAAVVTPAMAVMYSTIKTNSGAAISSGPWLIAAVASLFSENFILALLHVSKLFFRAVSPVNAVSAKEQFVAEKDVTKEEQDAIWEKIDTADEYKQVIVGSNLKSPKEEHS